MARTPKHVPVLLDEAVKLLRVRRGEKYIDATVGGGGHAETICKAGGVVLGIDWDKEALRAARRKLKEACPASSWRLAYGNFAQVEGIAKNLGFFPVAGVLFDLGTSALQLNTAKRGFSFIKEGPLDMRMDKNLGVTAADLVNSLSEKELFEIFSKWGEEKLARPIARRIVDGRKMRPFSNTRQLVDLIEEVYGRGRRGRARRHPATRVFMALRMAVNFELDNLKGGLSGATRLLATGGRLVVISFHSGEDRVVKQFLRQGERGGEIKILTARPIEPGEEEIKKNVRARSAKLRAGKKIKNS